MANRQVVYECKSRCKDTNKLVNDLLRTSVFELYVLGGNHYRLMYILDKSVPPTHFAFSPSAKGKNNTNLIKQDLRRKGLQQYIPLQ